MQINGSTYIKEFDDWSNLCDDTTTSKVEVQKFGNVAVYRFNTKTDPEKSKKYLALFDKLDLMPMVSVEKPAVKFDQVAQKACIDRQTDVVVQALESAKNATFMNAMNIDQVKINLVNALDPRLKQDDLKFKVNIYDDPIFEVQALLDKIKSRTPAVDTTNAQAKIDEAKAAVEAQAAKAYVIEFNNESGLRVGASTAKTQMRADIKAVREKIRLARQAVVDTLKAAKSL